LGDDKSTAPSIEIANVDDVRAIVDLIGAVYAEYNFIFEPEIELPDLFHFRQHYDAPRGRFFVMRERGGVIGSVGAERIGLETAEIHRLYLASAFRGRGMGRALVERVLEWCRERAIAHVILWSDTRFDRAHNLYVKMGFERAGERSLNDVNGSREYGFRRRV
jgi:putative acetyltransferase